MLHSIATRKEIIKTSLADHKLKCQRTAMLHVKYELSTAVHWLELQCSCEVYMSTYNWKPCPMHCSMKPYKTKVPNCALFFLMRTVCYTFPWKMKYCSVYITINQFKYCLHSCTTGSIAHRCGLEATIALSFASCYISFTTTPLCNITVVHSP